MSSLSDWGWLVPVFLEALRLAREVLAYLRVRAMSKKDTSTVYVSTTEAARRLGCQEHHLRRIFERGFLAEPPRLNKRRILLESDLPAIRAALIAAGYLPEPAAGA